MSATKWVVGLALVAVGVAGSPRPARSQEQPDMERWLETCRVGPEHERLAPWIGKWDTTYRMWMQPGEPMESPGTVEWSWLMDGRWLQQRGRGEVMGRPTEVFSLLGYDRFKRKYVATDVSSMTTQMLHAEGGFDADGTALILYGPMDEPLTGEHDKPVKYVWRLRSRDRMVLEIHDLAIGEANTRVVEVEYRRRAE